MDQLEPGSSVYNLPFAIHLRGRLDQKALLGSLNQVLKRHETLRTTFRAENGVPVQVVLSETTLELPVVNLEIFSEAKRETEAKQIMTAESAKPFDLACGPLVRAQLLRLGTEHHIFLLTFHHIIFDGWSVDVLLNELAAGYVAHHGVGGQIELPELPVQFADFAAWQHQHLTPEV